MKFPSRQQVEMVRKQYPVGTRVELVQMDDAQAPPIGTAGTVTGIDDTGSILVDWDNGSGLNVIYGEDIVRKICPVCGGPLTEHPALSRRDNRTEVCPDCGIRQALSDFGMHEAGQEEILALVHQKVSK